MALRTHFEQTKIGCPGVAEFTVQRPEALFDHITGFRQIPVTFGLRFRQRTVAVGFGIGEVVPLSEQDGFEHGQQGIGGTTAVVSKVTGSLTVQVLFDRVPINHLIQLQIVGSGRCVWQSWLMRFAGRRCSWKIP